MFMLKLITNLVFIQKLYDNIKIIVYYFEYREYIL